MNEPRGVNGRADCVARGQGSTRAVPTNSCFRFDPIMNSIVADKRGGAFADDLYVVLVDNRNGTIRDSNNDVFFYKSTDGGVDVDRPDAGEQRPVGGTDRTRTRTECDETRARALATAVATPGRSPGTQSGCLEHNFGADQFFPWVTIDTKGNLNVTFHDRRNDTDSPVGRGPWPTSKTEVGQLPGLVLGRHLQDHADADRDRRDRPVPAARSQCVAPEAIVNPGRSAHGGGFNLDAPPGAVPGQGQNSKTLPFKNFQISDIGSNFDYTFRAGLFAGDYSGNTSGPLVNGDTKDGHGEGGDGHAAAFWTDARNGRGSGDPTSFEPGRNPICEQSDVFFDDYGLPGGDKGHGKGEGMTKAEQAFLVAPCPPGTLPGDKH